jgi:hypothetical protein
LIASVLALFFLIGSKQIGETRDVFAPPIKTKGHEQSALNVDRHEIFGGVDLQAGEPSHFGVLDVGTEDRGPLDDLPRACAEIFAAAEVGLDFFDQGMGETGRVSPVIHVVEGQQSDLWPGTGVAVLVGI